VSKKKKKASRSEVNHATWAAPIERGQWNREKSETESPRVQPQVTKRTQGTGGYKKQDRKSKWHVE